jgi:hypothetical protein
MALKTTLLFNVRAQRLHIEKAKSGAKEYTLV